jgi:hypothetical protein
VIREIRGQSEFGCGFAVLGNPWVDLSFPDSMLDWTFDLPASVFSVISCSTEFFHS